MGVVNFSVDYKLIESLKTVIDFEYFVETGTYKGDTIEIVKPYFRKIYSIELIHEYFIAAQERYKQDNNVKILEGDSRNVLKKLKQQLGNAPTFFWLDAHFCLLDKSNHTLPECPLIEELVALGGVSEDSFIAIDDARFFLSPCPPCDISQWPTLTSVINHLSQLSTKHDLMVVNDCILFYPKKIEKEMRRYSYEYSVDRYRSYKKSRKFNNLLIKLVDKDGCVSRAGDVPIKEATI